MGLSQMVKEVKVTYEEATSTTEADSGVSAVGIGVDETNVPRARSVEMVDMYIL